MNCRDIEPLLLAERDGVLTAEQHAALAAHVAACPACRQLHANLTEAALFLKTDAANVTVPDAGEEWRKLRSQLQGVEARTAKRHPLAPVIWFGTPLAAAAAAIAVVFFTGRPSPRPAVTPAPLVATASVDPIGADDSAAPTMSYVDKESGWLVVWTTDANTKGSG
jgi:predicted anti-sigma-YlaC factor YlaD